MRALGLFAAHIERLVRREAVAFYFILGERFEELHFFHGESGRGEALGIVLSVEAHVVVLKEAALTFGRVRDAGILVGHRDTRYPGHLEDAPSARFHDAV